MNIRWNDRKSLDKNKRLITCGHIRLKLGRKITKEKPQLNYFKDQSTPSTKICTESIPQPC